MLTYHPAFDLSHCIFRILKILKYTSSWTEVEVDRLRIWDFYFLFPREITNQIKFPSNLVKLKRLFKENTNPYEELSDASKIFVRMKPYQEAALKNLASYGIVDPVELEKRIVKIYLDRIPEELEGYLDDLDFKEENALKLLTRFLGDLPLLGHEGFKMRTGLIEYKYDR
ncbi:MAG: hypothetical protein MI974_31785 [Chitinophagales bacterium]|nr:hypothetical protein [Chitinophagales bacterium]